MANTRTGVVIVGFPRSGTTLLRSIFAAQEHGWRTLEVEIAWYFDLAASLNNTGHQTPENVWGFLERHPKYPTAGRWPHLTVARDQFLGECERECSARSALGATMRILLGDSHDDRYVVKYPRLVARPEFVESMFDETIAIRMIRDPRAAILSHRKRWPARDIASVTALWLESVRDLAPPTDPNTRWIDLRYEDLVRQPVATLESLGRAIGEATVQPPGPAPVREAAGPVDELQSSGGISPARTQLWHSELRASEVAYIQRRTADQMRRLGYETVPFNGSRRLAAIEHDVAGVVHSSVRSAKGLARRALRRTSGGLPAAGKSLGPR